MYRFIIIETNISAPTLSRRSLSLLKFHR